MTTAHATTVRTVEFLRFSNTSAKALDMVREMNLTKPDGVTLSQTAGYQGGSDLLIFWGPGAPDRQEPMRRQLAAGGHFVALDLAYWDRDRKLKTSIDAPHPQKLVMRKDYGRERVANDQIRVDDVWDPNGPILVGGLGVKARVQYGAEFIDQWEQEMVSACRAKFGPERPILYRRKNGLGAAELPLGSSAANDQQSIEEALVGTSLAITWHSNVAVDAIRLGVPALCRDGAASAVCPSALPEFGIPQPLTTHLRDYFLSNLAWCQWAPSESAAMWTWLLELLSC